MSDNAGYTQSQGKRPLQPLPLRSGPPDEEAPVTKRPSLQSAQSKPGEEHNSQSLESTHTKDTYYKSYARRLARKPAEQAG